MIKSCLIVESKIVEKRVYPLYSRVTIGRKSINDISLPDRTVSKQHAVVGRVKGKVVVKDLGSRNGSFVNGEKIEKAVLVCGDRLKIGGINLRFFRQKEAVGREDTNSSDSSPGTQRLAEYLLEAGIVDQFSLQRALGEEENGKTIDEVLLDTGVIGDVSIAKALSRQLTIPLIGLKNVDIPQQVVSLVPVEVAKKHLLVPVKESEGTLLVAMADPLDEEAIRVLRVAAQMKIEIAVSSRQEVLEVLERIYPMEYLDQIFADNPDSDDVTVDL